MSGLPGDAVFSLRRAAVFLFGASVVIVAGILYRLHALRSRRRRGLVGAARRRRYLEAKAKEAGRSRAPEPSRSCRRLSVAAAPTDRL